MELEVWVSMLSWFAGSFICGLCGLGAAIIAMPFMMLVLPVQKVILVSCLTSAGLTIAMALYYRRYCRWHTVLWMAAGAVPGSCVGIVVLKSVSASFLELVVGLMLVFCIVGMQFFQGKLEMQDRARNCFAAGLLAGVIGTSITIDGPVVALYALFIGLGPMEFLGVTSMFFFLRVLVSDAAQAVSGLYTWEMARLALFCTPVSLLGFALSVPVVRRIDVTAFRTVVKVIILLAGLMCLGRALF